MAILCIEEFLVSGEGELTSRVLLVATIFRDKEYECNTGRCAFEFSHADLELGHVCGWPNELRSWISRRCLNNLDQAVSLLNEALARDLSISYLVLRSSRFEAVLVC